MSRIDKYDGKVGGFRAPLGFVPSAGQLSTALAVGLNANGQIVLGPGNTGIKGVLVLTKVLAVGDIADVMTHGELVEFPGVAGTSYFGAADGSVNTTNTGVALGFTVEASRLIVRTKVSGGAA